MRFVLIKALCAIYWGAHRPLLIPSVTFTLSMASAGQLNYTHRHFQMNTPPVTWRLRSVYVKRNQVGAVICYPDQVPLSYPWSELQIRESIDENKTPLTYGGLEMPRMSWRPSQLRLCSAITDTAFHVSTGLPLSSGHFQRHPVI